METLMSMDEKDLARQLHETREDTQEWEDGRTEIESRPSGSQVVSFRMPTEEFELLQNDLEATGEKLAEYIRKAIAIRLHGVPIGPTVELTSGATRLTIRSHIVTEARRGSSFAENLVPDYGPATAAL